MQDLKSYRTGHEVGSRFLLARVEMLGKVLKSSNDHFLFKRG